MLEIKLKSFKALNIQELYDILQLRTEVFVVEQDCVYQDMDGKDQKALHVLGFKKGVLVAYTRIFKPGDYFEDASIGRVVVGKNERSFNYGQLIMQASINALEENFNQKRIRISSQVYIQEFYKKLGFKPVGEEYLEDNIPHIAMIKEK
ncbi:GNAT family N-acetyltransferase [Seonamhaeicola sp. ML3]|uniref:GNAT family N-acetyltransferase n=1 Tax=Seonamhaeicola sp. ML3 TaxID=2937786 RepID=UPI00200D79D7|nr:GNAT family N-acetyltransferase [Seonamhaeicola sp. ML3]